VTHGDVTFGARLLLNAGGGVVFSDTANWSAGKGSEPPLDAAQWPGHVTVFENGHAFTFGIADPLDVVTDTAGGSMRAPMPGLVKLARAQAGEIVTKGQPLLVLEAMKMEHTITASHDGTIAEIAAEGAQVSEGTVLVRFAEDA
jgi:3-methylcrotonyl-CoA carboxylase alpha subunit